MDNTIKNHQGQSIDVYNDKIDYAIDDYINTHSDIVGYSKETGEPFYQPVNLHTITQNRWNAVLTHVYKLVFSERRDNRQKNNIDYTDIDLLNALCDKYISLCNEYDKEICINGYSKFTGINHGILFDWLKGTNRSTVYYDVYNNYIYNIQIYKINNRDNQYLLDNVKEIANSSYSDLVKKIQRENENSLSDKAVSGKGGVGVIAALNHRHDWTAPQKIVVENKTAALVSRDDIVKELGYNPENVVDDLDTIPDIGSL